LHDVTVIVWRDYNDDGVKDAGEPTIPGIQVQLVKGSSITTNYTDGTGQWNFGSLLYGNVSVNVFLPNTSWIFSPFNNVGSGVMTVNSLNGTTFSIFLGPTPSSFTYYVGMLYLDYVTLNAPLDMDSCLASTNGTNVAYGELVTLYPTVTLTENTPIATFVISLTGAMSIIKTTVVIGSG
jgi:hypothetical protein